APVRPQLFGAQVADVRLAPLDQLLGVLVELREVVRGVVEPVTPVEAQPADVLLDGLDELFLFGGRVGVVEAEVAQAPVGFGGAEVDPDGLGVTDVQVAVGLGREAGVHPPAVPPRRPVGVDDLLDEMGWLLPWFCHRDRSLQASFSCSEWHYYTISLPFVARCITAK